MRPGAAAWQGGASSGPHRSGPGTRIRPAMGRGYRRGAEAADGRDGESGSFLAGQGLKCDLCERFARRVGLSASAGSGRLGGLPRTVSAGRRARRRCGAEADEPEGQAPCTAALVAAVVRPSIRVWSPGPGAARGSVDLHRVIEPAAARPGRNRSTGGPRRRGGLRLMSGRTSPGAVNGEPPRSARNRSSAARRGTPAGWLQLVLDSSPPERVPRAVGSYPSCSWPARCREEVSAVGSCSNAEIAARMRRYCGPLAALTEPMLSCAMPTAMIITPRGGNLPT